MEEEEKFAKEADNLKKRLAEEYDVREQGARKEEQLKAKEMCEQVKRFVHLPSVVSVFCILRDRNQDVGLQRLSCV